jgi:hypothetical protein
VARVRYFNESVKAKKYLNSQGIYVPVGWQIYARHGKASGRTFFSDKPTVVFTPYGRKNSWLQIFSYYFLVASVDAHLKTDGQVCFKFGVVDPLFINFGVYHYKFFCLFL